MSQETNQETTPIIFLDDVSVTFKTRTGSILHPNRVKAVQNLSLKLFPGETIGIVGESGCGKSTTANVMCGLQQPTSGHVYFKGEDVTKRSAAQRKLIGRVISVVFQDPATALNARMSIHDQLMDPMVVHNVGTPEEREKLYREVFSSDVFLTGTNAVTEHGELYNVDGNGNRVAAMLFGPKKVLVFAGCNKIVRDIDDAAKRVKSCATPANAMRLNLDTPCTHGACPGTDGELCAGCRSENRICAMYTVLARQRVKGRIHVILIGEEVGY